MKNEIINGDCRDYMQLKVDMVLTDPPYPNYKHFINDVLSAEQFLSTFNCENLMVFWDEMKEPPIRLPIVAKHVWHRTNTNRPDNYEMIYHYHSDGRKRASRVLRHPVVYPGLTGCIEATGHPTQKPVSLIRELLSLAGMGIGNLVFDPFSGSGTTAIACYRSGIDFICIEKNTGFWSDSKRRLSEEMAQTSLFKNGTLDTAEAEQTSHNTPMAGGVPPQICEAQTSP